MSAEIRIGTSGWHYKHWLGKFYPERWPASRMLEFYRERFDTVEINNSFYQLPRESALAQWRESTGPDFRFALKGSRYLTHMKKLKDPEVGLERFLARADLLGDRLGPILFQLPPQWDVNVERLARFLELLPRFHRYAFEFRNPAWDCEDVYQLLRTHGAAYCIFHLAGYESPVKVTADFVYIRLHGPGGKYQGSYDDGSLGAVAQRIRSWREELRAIYVYFDNDEAGYAPRDAMRLREMVGS